MRRFLFSLPLFLVASLASAQHCTLLNDGSLVFKISPAQPTINDVVRITGGRIAWVPFYPPGAVVNGKTIDVTLYGGPSTVWAPMSCTGVIVGPLARGTYTVNLFLGGRPSEGPFGTPIASKLLVVGGGDPLGEPIPASGPVTLIAVALFLALAGVFALRSKRR